MSAPAILSRLKRAGVTVAVVGGQLKFEGPKSVLSGEVVAELKAHKPELLALLSQGGTAPPAATAWQLDHDGIAERIEAWLHAVDRLPKACGPDGQRLKALTTDFLLGCWACPAVQHGWSDADLFALDGGLIPEMARRALHFRAIGEDAISLINGRGQYEEWERRDMADAVPWWGDDRCVARFH